MKKLENFFLLELSRNGTCWITDNSIVNSKTVNGFKAKLVKERSVGLFLD